MKNVLKIKWWKLRIVSFDDNEIKNENEKVIEFKANPLVETAKQYHIRGFL